MTKSKAEYRINKKGAECFRTQFSAEAYAKYQELNAKRPGVYTMQVRLCKLDRYGVMEHTASGTPLWSSWQ